MAEITHISDETDTPRKKSKSSKPTPTLENEKEAFNQETLEMIRIFRGARAKWMETEEKEEGAETDLFGTGTETKGRYNWLKKLAKILGMKSQADDSIKKESEKDEDGKGAIEIQTEIIPEKPEKKAGRKGRKEVRTSEEEELEDDECLRKCLTALERKRRKEKSKKGGKKVLKFKKLPEAGEECRCKDSGEYTVLVKGVCFCGKKRRPTCIPIIPPEYFSGDVKDYEIKKKDSLVLYKKAPEKKSIPDSKSRNREKEDGKKKKISSDKGIRKTSKSCKPEEECTTSAEKTESDRRRESESDSEKQIIEELEEDIEIHKVTSSAQDKIHSPLIFRDLAEDDNADARSTLSTVSDNSDLEAHELKRKKSYTRLPKSASTFLIEKRISDAVKAAEPEKSKDGKQLKSILDEPGKSHQHPHGHVHFDTKPEKSDRDSDTNNYLTKYGEGADEHKRKNQKTTMILLIDSVYDWWKGNKPKNVDSEMNI